MCASEDKGARDRCRSSWSGGGWRRGRCEQISSGAPRIPQQLIDDIGKCGLHSPEQRVAIGTASLVCGGH